MAPWRGYGAGGHTAAAAVRGALAVRKYVLTKLFTYAIEMVLC